MKNQNKSQLDIAKDLLEVECLDWQRFLQKEFLGTKISTEAVRSIILGVRGQTLSDASNSLHELSFINSQLKEIHEKHSYRPRP